MGNGQWAMGNGQWAMGNGQWAMGNGQWAMGNGQWAMGNGQWGMGDGGWGMGDGGWGMGDGDATEDQDMHHIHRAQSCEPSSKTSVNQHIKVLRTACPALRTPPNCFDKANLFHPPQSLQRWQPSSISPSISADCWVSEDEEEEDSLSSMLEL
jgi:hypothetical protein